MTPSPIEQAARVIWEFPEPPNSLSWAEALEWYREGQRENPEGCTSYSTVADALNLAQALHEAGMLVSGEPVALDNWHEDDGNKLWWRFPVTEAPYAGTPNDDGWPGYHTHYTDIPLPTEDRSDG